MTKYRMQACGLLLLLLMGGCAVVQAPSPEPASAQASKPPAKAGITLERALEPTRLRAGQCAGPACQIAIKVTQKDGQCVAKPVDDIVKLTHPGVEVYWIITTNTYHFPNSRGIELATPGHPFGGSKRIDDVTWYWKGTTGHSKGYWSYTVQVLDASGRACATDPGLVTDW
jgi:hypothetical protein